MPDPAYVLIVNILGWIAIGVCCPLALFFSFKDLKKSVDTNKELKELVRSYSTDFNLDDEMFSTNYSHMSTEKMINKLALESKVLEKVYLDMRKSDRWKSLVQHTEELNMKRRLLHRYAEIREGK